MRLAHKRQPMSEIAACLHLVTQKASLFSFNKVAFGLEFCMTKGQRDENSGQATGTRNLWASFFHSNLHSSALSQGCVAVYSKVGLDLQSVFDVQPQ